MHVRRGEIVALLGENGAGKSTLVNQIFGLITPDTGTVSVAATRPRSRTRATPSGAASAWCTSTSSWCPVMTVAENMMLGARADQGRPGARHRERPRDGAHAVGQARPAVDPDAEIEDLPVGTQQRVEILKALSRRSTC